ncbi:MAG: type transport system ATP-binding protein [Clostridiales bacterium]|nr:type transport system ATP-binding protein [Clostridiales bacterium]MDN5281708.1 type transport system ATP-binding protein [Candidatus Ozemobacter sp.]
MNPAISVEDLSKSFAGNRVVNGISFRVEAGEIFGFLGPNGAGKTTSIRMMIGEISKDQGSIEIKGLSVPQNMAEVKKLIGVVPDNQNLYDRLTVRQNLEFFADLNNVEHSRIDEILEKVFLTEHQHKAATNLSRGLRQRTLIARGLLHKPEIFFLDEPTSALDPNSALLIRQLVRELRNQGTTIFLTTHYMEEADDLCDRLAIMHRGNIVACGNSSDLKKNYGRESILMDYQENDVIKTAEYSLTDEQQRKKAAELLASGRILKIHSQEASLEEVFLRVTGSEWHESEESQNES